MLANILNSKATKKFYYAWCFLDKKENTLSGAILFFATVYNNLKRKIYACKQIIRSFLGHLIILFPIPDIKINGTTPLRRRCNEHVVLLTTCHLFIKSLKLIFLGQKGKKSKIHYLAKI